MDRSAVVEQGDKLLAKLRDDPTSLDIWQEGIANQWFRLNTLYDIKDRDGQQIQLKPNPEQRDYYVNSHNRDLILKARQLGFTTFKQILELDNCLFTKNHAAACIAQDVDTVKDIFDNKIKFAYENINQEFVLKITGGKFSLPRPTIDKSNAYKFSNGSSFSVGTGYRGGTLQSLHVSEFGKICKKRPDVAKEIITGSCEAVAKNGSIVFESTAEGREGYFYDYCTAAAKRVVHTILQNKLHFYPWWRNPEYTLDDGEITPRLERYFSDLKHKHGISLELDQRRWYSAKEEGLGDDIFREYPSTIEEPFKVAIEGAYYSRQFSKVYKEKRIGDPLNDSKDGINTAWDIGTGDSTAIWFYRVVGAEIHLIDYYENNGVGIDHYMKVCSDKGYVYKKHYGPHDMDNRQFANKAKTLKQLAKEGIQCDEDGSDGPVYKMDFTIVPKSGVNDGIGLVRDMLSRCYFYLKETERGVLCLENYRKEWDKKNGCWKDNPLHDWASDGADAFRYLANAENGKKQVTVTTNNPFG